MNQLKMDLHKAISSLSSSGWSQRRIARELGIDRETVARYRRVARQAEAPKPAISPPGSEGVGGVNPAIAPSSSGPILEANPPIAPPGSKPPAVGSAGPNPAISPAGSKAGRVSQCALFESFIKTGLDVGLSAQRIYQDLVSEQKFEGSYDSVKRIGSNPNSIPRSCRSASIMAP